MSAEEAALKRALAHPRRLEILSFLTQKRGCAEAHMADELGLAFPLVAYHVRVLESADLVADTENPEQGATDRYVVATPN
ncbi:MAG: ArsR/SmtB family transcription factor [Chloroflexota bacterium]